MSAAVLVERYAGVMWRSVVAATARASPHGTCCRLSTVRRADVIAVVEGGRVTEQGSHDELLQLEGGTYQRLISTAELGSSSSSSSSADGSYWVQGAAYSSSSSSDDGDSRAAPGAAAATKTAAARAAA